MEETQQPEDPQTTPEMSESEHPSDQEVQERQETELAEERAEHLQRTEGTLPVEEELSDEGLSEEDDAN